jgi:hypothetical protein
MKVELSRGNHGSTGVFGEEIVAFAFLDFAAIIDRMEPIVDSVGPLLNWLEFRLLVSRNEYLGERIRGLAETLGSAVDGGLDLRYTRPTVE